MYQIWYSGLSNASVYIPKDLAGRIRRLQALGVKFNMSKAAQVGIRKELTRIERELRQTTTAIDRHNADS